VKIYVVIYQTEDSPQAPYAFKTKEDAETVANTDPMNTSVVECDFDGDYAFKLLHMAEGWYRVEGGNLSRWVATPLFFNTDEVETTCDHFSFSGRIYAKGATEAIEKAQKIYRKKGLKNK
jgi:hypothetical protein